MEILLWLAPAGVVMVLAMLWAGWQGRRGRVELDRAEGVRRLGRALEQPARSYGPAPRRTPERTRAVAVRRTPAEPLPEPPTGPPSEPPAAR